MTPASFRPLSPALLPLLLAAAMALPALAEPEGGTYLQMDPAVEYRDVLLMDPLQLAAMERAGFNLGHLAFSSPWAMHNAALARDPAYADLVSTLKADLKRLYRSDGNWGVGMRYSHRGFDLRWLTAASARWELAAVANRVDRKVFAPGTCGEIRFIYRLAYTVKTRSGPFSSRLPATLNVVFHHEDDGAGCGEAALRLRGRLNPGKPGKPKSVEVNIQTSRWPSTVRGDLGGHADYVLRVFRRQGPRLVSVPLENTPDVDRLRHDSKARRELLAWVRANAARIDSGIALVPEKFLAKGAVSVTPRGLARAQNRPWTRLFTPQELEGLSVPPKLLLRTLDGLTCMGCHQSRAVAGFHIIGDERDPGRRVDALALGISPHMEEDLPRRIQYIKSLASGQAPDERRRHPERQLGKGGFGAACGLDPAFARWTCDPGFTCQAVDETEVGQCMPAQRGVGSACATGAVDFSKDRIAKATDQECGGIAYCEGVSVGFPGGMCASPCTVHGDHSVCGGIAILQPFNECLARGELFTKCAGHSRPALLRQCGSGDPCRPDYICARTAGGESACLPPYFVLQMRVDGHPKPQ